MAETRVDAARARHALRGLRGQGRARAAPRAAASRRRRSTSPPSGPPSRSIPRGRPSPALQAAVAAAGYELARGARRAAARPRTASARRARARAAARCGAGWSSAPLLSVPRRSSAACRSCSRGRRRGCAIPWLLLALTTPVQFWVGGRVPSRLPARPPPPEREHVHAGLARAPTPPTSSAWRSRSGRTCSWPRGAMTYYETAAVVITLVVLGRWLEARARGRTSEAIRRLVSLAPRTARVLRDGRRGRRARPPRCCVGDLVRIRPGERVPVDGVVIEGASTRRRVDAHRREPARRQGGRAPACSAAR